MNRCESTGKLIFATEDDVRAELAKIVVRAMTGQRRGKPLDAGGDAGNREIAAYECRPCGGFHLTARPWTTELVRRLEVTA